ncbi:hypothetical protein ACWEGE_30420 [Amycolatopsis sp. NPDC004747]
MLVVGWLFGATAAASGDTPWWLTPEVLGAVLGAVAGALVTYVFGRRGISQQNKLLGSKLQEMERESDRLTAELDQATQNVRTLEGFSRKYHEVVDRLKASSVVNEYVQPVLLLGPRNVGKTSLMMQWHAPWDHSRFGATTTHRESTVPVYDFEKPDAVPHFADPDILTREHAHLKLRVHDFPGELSAQQRVVEVALQETDQVKRNTGKNLGVVVICMFDSIVAIDGVDNKTSEYYNGDLFANLRTLVGHHEIDIQRLVIVFNKFDLLAKRRPGVSVSDLLDLCVTACSDVLKPLRGVCNQEKVCETVTVCDRDNALANQGTSIVLGEAARGLVAAVAGKAAENDLVGPMAATTKTSKIFVPWQ